MTPTNPKSVLTNGMGLQGHRFSPLKLINTSNVKDLVPAWSFSYGGEKQRGQEGQALVHDGVVYITALLQPHLRHGRQDRRQAVGI